MNVVVIGGGASGLMAAGTAAEKGHTVTVVEKNSRPARKLLITGKGRCNVTNMCGIDEMLNSIVHNPRFLYGAFSRFTPQDTVDFFENLGVKLKVERGNRVFPQSDKAVDIVDALVGYAKNKAKIISAKAKALVISNGAVTGVKLDDGKVIDCDSVIIATGGLSYPKTGSDGDGYILAMQAGHTVVKTKPSLVPLEIKESYCRYLMGLSLKNISVSFEHNGKIIYNDFGEMLFTHFGVSGPVILSGSCHIDEPKGVILHIDLKPALSIEQLDDRFLRDFSKYSSRELSNALNDLYPKSLIPIIIKLSGIRPDTKVSQISKEMRMRLVNVTKDMRLTVSGFRPFDEAIITSGGICTKEINPSTLESKLCKGLFFCGEVIDVDAYTGGFNLQIAFSTGRLAGNSV